MTIINNSLITDNNCFQNSFAEPLEKISDYSQDVLEENLKTLGEIAHAEYNKDFKAICDLEEKLHPDFYQKLMNSISRVGFLSKEIILQVQTEICVELLLLAVRQEENQKVSELLNQLIWINPQNIKLYECLWNICGQPNIEQWGEHAFHGRIGYFAAAAAKETAILEFRKLLLNRWNEYLLLPSSILTSLETELKRECLTINLDHDCGIKDFLDPNEGNPQNIVPHLKAAQKFPGIPVCTGTERLFFLLLFSNVATCQGIVGRDINPKVKAYVDFNVALLRISKTVQEYEKLSSRIRPDDENLLKERISVIKNKIEISGLDAKIRKYYLENIQRFGEIYLTTKKNWRNRDPNYQHCRYDQNTDLFSKLKHYADSGNIIATVGSIDDLAFLKNRKVTVIDTSNIHLYSYLDFRGGGGFQPRIIWTDQNGYYTGYYSYIFKPLLNEEERNEFNELLNKIKAPGIRFAYAKYRFLSFTIGEGFQWEKDPLNAFNSVYSVENLNSLRTNVNRYLLQVPRLGFVDMGDVFSIGKLNGFSIEEIDELCRNPETQRFLKYLVGAWNVLDLRVYLAFGKIKGWKEAFEANFIQRRENLPGFLYQLKEHHLFEEFVLEFGQERLDALLSSIKKIEVPMGE